MVVASGSNGAQQARKPGLIQSTKAPDIKKLAPRTSVKKLPWLQVDGKPSSTASTPSPTRRPTIVPQPSLARSPGSHPSSLRTVKHPSPPPVSQHTTFLQSDPAIRPIGSTPTLRHTSLNPPTQRRVSYVGVNSPSSATGRRLAELPRKHNRVTIASPLKQTTSDVTPSPSKVSHKSFALETTESLSPTSSARPSQRLLGDAGSWRGIATITPDPLIRSATPVSVRRSSELGTHSNSQLPVPRAFKPPSRTASALSGYIQMQDSASRRPSLALMPDHLEGSTSPGSMKGPIQRNALCASPHVIGRSAALSATQPNPKRDSLEQQSRKLTNAIEDLEDLVQEAVDIVEGTTDQQQIEDVYGIVEGATNALRRASVADTQQLMLKEEPLEISDSSEVFTEFSTVSESQGSDLPDEPSPKHSSGIQAISPIQRNILANGPITDQRQPVVEPEGSMLTTPPSLYAPRASVAIDFAYRNSHDKSLERSLFSEESDTEEDIGVRRSRFSTRSDLLLPPEPSQPGSRENTNFVMRPAMTDNTNRGRSRRRKRSRNDAEDGRRRRLKDSLHRRGHRSSDYRMYGLSDPDDFYDKEDMESRTRVKRKHHRREISVRDQARHHTFDLRRHHRRQPVARNWTTGRKRITATVACINTALIGIIIGIYAGEVPRMQYVLADERHHVIVGNVVLYFGMALSTFISWPLPLLHGRKPYVLAALALALPLQFPQALVISQKRSPNNPAFMTGLLVSRGFTGLVLGFANVNYVSVLFDLFGASLQSKNPHQEFVIANDVRRHGGGMGLWLGIYSWCSIGSIAVGFQVGAAIIETLSPDWGFYITMMLLAAALLMNILAPETRRAAYRKSVTEVYDRDEHFITRRVARGEVKLHINTEGPLYWFEEVWAGIKLTTMMLFQAGFAVLAFYLGWIYAQVVLVIVLLGALLSRDYRWRPQYVGLGVMSIAIGALLALPLTKAGLFSRDRKRSFRTDSMTFEKQVTWSSHLVRRVFFTVALPLMGLAYTVSSAGRPKPWMVPIAFAGAVGFLSTLAIAECHGLIMETFDTCDLQPGVNTKHRLQSMAVTDRRRRTNYSSFPRVSAGIFASQSLAFIGAGIATEVGGIMTRHLGAQASTGVTAGILLSLTLLLTAVLWRFKQVQVIPNHAFGTRRDSKAWEEFREGKGSDWKAVIVGNPSGKMRKMSVLELGGLSRWTEIRKLNYLVRDGDSERGWY